MKRFLKFLSGLFAVAIFIIELAEILGLPIAFLLIGIFCDMPWQFYLISIGGYFVLLVIAEIVVRLIFKSTSPILKRKLERLFDRLNRNSNEDF